MTRGEAIQYLVTNCDCWKGDKATLDQFDNTKVKRLYDAAQRAEAAEGVINAVASVPGAAELIEAGELTVNTMPQFLTGVVVANGNTGGEGYEPGVMTEEQFLAAMPDSLKSVFNSAIEVEKETRAGLIKQLVANLRGTDRTEMIQDLAGEPTAKLKKLLKLSGGGNGTFNALNPNPLADLYDPKTYQSKQDIGYGDNLEEIPMYAGSPGGGGNLIGNRGEQQDPNAADAITDNSLHLIPTRIDWTKDLNGKN